MLGSVTGLVVFPVTGSTCFMIISSGPVDGVMVSGYSVGVTNANIPTFTSPWPPEKET